MSKIKIIEDFSSNIGVRNRSDGPFSGEEFREDLLLPKYSALKPGEKLEIDFDGTYGYPPSFLEEAFGGLVRKIGNPEDIINKLELKAEEEPYLVNEIKNCIMNAFKKK